MNNNCRWLDGWQKYIEEVQAILETTRKPFLILDSAMKVLATNQRFFKTFGLSSSEVLGMSLYSLDHDEWDIPALRTLLEVDLQNETAVDDFEVVHTFSRLGRKILHINAKCHEPGAISKQFTLLSIEDFTRRKLMEEQLRESEERFRRIFETSKDGLLLIDKHTGVIKSSNQAVMEMLGVEQMELLEKPFASAGIFEGEDDFHRILDALQVNGFLRRHCKLLNRRENKEFDAEIFIVNRATLIQCNVRDITERRIAEEERQRLKEQLYQAQRLESIGRLAAGVAHDFNNLLFIIMGNSELLLEDLLKAHPMRESLEEIYQAAFRARGLTGQLLSFGRKQILEMKCEDINEVVLGFEKLLRRIIGEDIELRLKLSPEKLLVVVDASHLEQVLMNLAVNSRDAMPDGGILSLETTVSELDRGYAEKHPGVDPGTYAMIAVSDTGNGMDRETLTHIFEPFFTTKGKEKGTGLGLATCYGIVKQHGGNIWVYSEPGQGTTFRIYLPLASGTSKSSIKGPPNVRAATGGETVMVIEDDPSVRKITCGILTRFGYHVIQSAGVTDALEKASNSQVPIDLVVTDVVMPGLKGPEVYERIQEIYPRAKVLYMSGYTDEVIVHRGVLDKGVQFIQKPFSMLALSHKIRKLLDEA